MPSPTPPVSRCRSPPWRSLSGSERSPELPIPAIRQHTAFAGRRPTLGARPRSDGCLVLDLIVQIGLRRSGIDFQPHPASLGAADRALVDHLNAGGVESRD